VVKDKKATVRKKNPKEFYKDFVKEDFRFFKDTYSSENEMLEYCLKFQQIHRTLKRAFDDFFSISEFYQAMKFVKNDFTKLMMITSIIEKLRSTRDYMDFSEWISEEEKEGTLSGKGIHKIWQEYNMDFGCSGKFRGFFKNPDYLRKTEQITLLKSICYFIRNDDGSISLVPLFCYNKEKCGIRDNGCEYDRDANCTAFNEEKVLNDGIKEFADFLYHLRNKFVHEAHMFRLSREEFGTTSFLLDYVTKYKFRHIEKPSSYREQVVFRLSVEKLEGILNRNFKKLLDNYIETRKSAQQKPFIEKGFD